MFKRKKEIRYKIPELYCDKMLGEDIVKCLAHVLCQEVHIEVYEGKKMIDSGDIHVFFKTPEE